jgi:hypothetical protein
MIYYVFSGRLWYHWIMDETPPLPEPLWTQDEAIDFEVAREAINRVMSICTHQIANEERKADPDFVVIEALSDRLANLHRQRTELRLKDHAEITRIRKEYGAIVRAWNAHQSDLAAE